MNYLVATVGTRGDVEPFLAIAEGLLRRGHRVVFALPAQYAHLVPAACTVYPFTPRFLELLESPTGRMLMGGGGSGWRRIRGFYHLYREGKVINKELARTQGEILIAEGIQAVVYHVKCSVPLLFRLGRGLRTTLVSPVPYFLHPVRGQPHVGLPRFPGRRLNRLTYGLANFGLAKTITDAQDDVDLPFPRQRRRDIQTALEAEKVAFVVSPTLFRRPQYWPEYARVTGYLDRDRTTEWEPPENLLAFLDRHPNPLLLTFGSMVNATPEQTTRHLLTATEVLELPVIVNTAAGGLLKLPELTESGRIHFTTTVPYDWLAPRCRAIVHHGGAGTTHQGLRHGLPTMIIPHLFDQFAWNQLVAERGYGPLGPKIKTLLKTPLSPLLEDLCGNSAYRKKTTRAARAMERENATEQLLDFIEAKAPNTVQPFSSRS